MNAILRLDIIEHVLRDVGYHPPDGSIVRDFDYVSSISKIKKADMITFADPRRQDISTSCIVVESCEEGANRQKIIRDLAYTGAPLVLFALPDRLEIWPVKVESGDLDRAKSVLSYESVPNYFKERGRELSPRRLLNAKRGDKQLTFFDIDHNLEEFAREATQQILVEQFELALASALKLTPLLTQQKYPAALNHLAIWVLAARILQDKLKDEKSLQTQDVFSLLTASQTLFPKYFTTLNQAIALVGKKAVERLYEELYHGFTFRSLTNDMLAYFYENALVSNDMRKDLGIYYTPRTIAQRILQRLPIEQFSPEDRIVLDGTCGSGNLLLASYERLSSLLPAKTNLEERHNYLLNHIWGIDTDFFACEIARLSLLLYDLPTGDSWQIIQKDIFESEPEKMFGGKPHIIVGNPPFKESNEGPRTQKAAKILDRYLEWLAPGGLFGVVLPLTFLHNPSADTTRATLLNTCEILEVWHMPEKAIPTSTAATAVILGKKVHQSPKISFSFLTRIDEAPRSIEQYKKPQLPTAFTSYVISQDDWVSHPKKRMNTSSFEQVWKRLESDFSPIHSEFGTVVNGVQIGKKARETHLSFDFPGEGWRPVLNTVRGALEPFSLHWGEQVYRYIKYPSPELHRARNPKDFEVVSKVVMNATRNPGSPWRFYAAIDLEKFVVVENFHYILPSKATSEEISSVLNSMIANAWYSRKNFQRNIAQEDVKMLPFPDFTSEQKEQIRNIVLTLSQTNLRSPKNKLVKEKLTFDMDEIIFDAYCITQEERSQIRQWMDLFPRPGFEKIGKDTMVKTLSSHSERLWKVTGAVEALDANRKTVSVWLQGLDEAEEIPIPQSMPGWALRSGVGFVATTPWEQRYEKDLGKISWLDFQPLDYDYLSDDALFALLDD